MSQAPSRTPMVLATIVAGALLVRLAFFAGYVGTDDIYYMQAAYRLSVGETAALNSHWAVRSAVVLPTAAVYRLGGVGLLTTAAWPLLCSLLEVVVAFCLGRRLFDQRTGLLAAALMAVFPLDVIFATELFATTPIGLFAGLGLYFFVRDDGPQRATSLFWAGLSFGVATLAGDIAALCLLPVGWFFLFRATQRQRYVWLAVGYVAALGIECLLYAALVGDALHRWHILSTVLASMGADALSSGFGLAYLIQPLARLFTEQELGLFPYLLLPALWYHVRRRPSVHSNFLVFWVVAIFLYTSYGSASPFRFAPMARLPRYYSSTTIAAMVLLAAYLVTWRNPFRNALIAALCVSSLACVWIDNGRSVRLPYRHLQEYIIAHPERRVAVTPPLLADVLFYSHFDVPKGLMLWVETPEEEQSLRRGPAIYASIPWVKRLEDLAGVDVALDGDRIPANAERLAHATQVATFEPPDRLYYRLLRNPLFMRLFALVRDPYRVQGLQALQHAEIVVYRLP